MSKLNARTLLSGASLSGANLKVAMLAIWDALNSGGFTDTSRSTITASATLTATQAGLVLVDATSASIVLTLPASGAATDDMLYQVRRIDASAVNTVTVVRSGTDTVEGAATAQPILAGETLDVQMPAGATNWRIKGGTMWAARAIQEQKFAAITTSGTLTAYTIAPSPAITAYKAGQSFFVTFHASSGTNPTLQISGVATPPNLVKQNADGTYSNIAASDIPINHRSRVTLLSASQALVETIPPEITSVGTGLAIASGVISAALRSYLAGLTLSTAGASTTMTVAAGQATDSANAVMMNLAAGIGKTTSAWAVGSAAGGLDTGSIAASTWYYFYLIRRTDTGMVDVVFSANSTSPTLPANYTQYRYIGAGLTNASSQWTKFVQFGDAFYWDVPVLDYSAAGSTTSSLVTISIPRGRKMTALINVVSSASGVSTLISSPDITDSAPSTTVAPLLSSGAASTNPGGSQVLSITDTSARVRRRETLAAGTIYMATVGWTDLRGKDL